MVMLDRCRLCFQHKKKEEKESIFNHYELRMLFERNFGISYRDLIKQKHLAVICVECRVKIQNATPQEMESYRFDARHHHHEVFYAETRVHFGLPKEWGENEDPFVRRSQRERKAVEDKAGDETCVMPPKRTKPEVKNQVQSNKSFKCTKCNKDFPSKSNLDCHMKEHREELVNTIVKGRTRASHARAKKSAAVLKKPQKRFNCTQCQNTYLHRSSLLKHIKKIHLKNVNHICDYCGKRFFHAYKLRDHIQNHVPVKDPQRTRPICHLCNARLVSSNALSMHLYNCHDVKGLFECDVCKKKFNTKKSLREHESNVHAPKRFKCALCVAAFYYNKSFKRHMKNVHRKIIKD